MHSTSKPAELDTALGESASDPGYGRELIGLGITEFVNHKPIGLGITEFVHHKLIDVVDINAPF